jgi:arginase
VSRWTFIGAPADSVLRGGGAELAPDRLRALELPARLAASDGGDLRVRVRGDRRDPVTGIVGSDDVIANAAIVRAAVHAHLEGGERVFLAGGCCANAPGAVAGARDVAGRVALVYIDGHQDMWDGQSSTTGEAADMPLGVAIGSGPRRWVEATGGAAVRASDVVLLGDRDLEEARAAGLADPSVRGVHHLPIELVRELGPNGAGVAALDTLDRTGAPSLWVHLDVDVLDMHVFPATDYLAPGGMSWDDLLAVMTPLVRSARLLGVSLGCFNPEKDPDGSCGETLVDLLVSILA